MPNIGVSTRVYWRMAAALRDHYFCCTGGRDGKKVQFKENGDDHTSFSQSCVGRKIFQPLEARFRGEGTNIWSRVWVTTPIGQGVVTIKKRMNYKIVLTNFLIRCATAKTNYRKHTNTNRWREFGSILSVINNTYAHMYSKFARVLD